MRPMSVATGKPLWQQVKDAICAEIENGAYRDGVLPSAGRLGAIYGVHPHTVRRALLELQTAGLVRVENGRGAFVQPHALDYRLGVRPFVDHILESGQVPGGQLLDATRVPATEKDRILLDLGPDDDVLLMKVVCESDGVPMVTSRHRMSYTRFADFPAIYEPTGLMPAAWAHFGFNSTTYGRRIRARQPSPEEARALQQPQTTPVLEAEYVSVDKKTKVPLKHSVAAFAAERVRLGTGDLSLLSTADPSP